MRKKEVKRKETNSKSVRNTCALSVTWFIRFERKTIRSNGFVWTSIRLIR